VNLQAWHVSHRRSLELKYARDVSGFNREVLCVFWMTWSGLSIETVHATHCSLNILSIALQDCTNNAQAGAF
jgi:hypothetical protein